VSRVFTESLEVDSITDINFSGSSTVHYKALLQQVFLLAWTVLYVSFIDDLVLVQHTAVRAVAEILSTCDHNVL